MHARNPLHYGAFGGRPGLHRLFTGEMGYEISWFLPAALFVIAFAAYLWRRAALSRDEKAALVMWTGWIMLCGTMFTYMDGMVHPYYTVAMAPAVRRVGGPGRRVGVAVSGPPVRCGRIGGHDRARGRVVGVATASRRSRPGMAALGDRALRRGGRRPGRVALGPARITAGLLAGIAGVTAFGIATATTPMTAPSQAAHRGEGRRRDSSAGAWMGDADEPSAGTALRATHTRWSAATDGSQSAAALEISSGTPVMAIGGWSRDPGADRRRLHRRRPGGEDHLLHRQRTRQSVALRPRDRRMGGAQLPATDIGGTRYIASP